jgi:hypothetical protein
MVREKLDRIIANRTAAVDRARRDDELKTLKPLIDYLADTYADSGGVIPFDMGEGGAAAVLRGLEEVGLLVPRGKVEEVAEKLAQERLAALKAEHALAV